MSRSKFMLASAVGAVITGSAAFGSVTVVGLVEVPITAAAKTDDPALANYRSFDLKVSISAGDHWASSDVQANAVASSKFYAADNTNGGYTPAYQKSNLTGARQLEFDTAVIAPILSGSRVNILGSSSRKQPAPDQTPIFPSNGHNWQVDTDPNTGDPIFAAANNQRVVDVSWGDVSASTSTATGVQSIARFTVLNTPDANGVLAVLVGQVKATSSPGSATLYTLTIGLVPEPVSVSLAGLGLGALALRRRVR